MGKKKLLWEMFRSKYLESLKKWVAMNTFLIRKVFPLVLKDLEPRNQILFSHDVKDYLEKYKKFAVVKASHLIQIKKISQKLFSEESGRRDLLDGLMLLHNFSKMFDNIFSVTVDLYMYGDQMVPEEYQSIIWRRYQTKAVQGAKDAGVLLKEVAKTKKSM